MTKSEKQHRFLVMSAAMADRRQYKAMTKRDRKDLRPVSLPNDLPSERKIARMQRKALYDRAIASGFSPYI